MIRFKDLTAPLIYQTIMTLLHIIAMIWVFGCLLLYVYTHYKGREISDYLRQTYLDKWEELGKPQPYFAVPNQTWSLFLSKEGYKSFEDRQLTEMCEKQRRLEKTTLVLAMMFFIVFGGIALWNQYLA